MRTKRTRMHNPDGTIIYNTFNSTGLTPQYESTNPRFNTKFGKQVNENVPARDSCTIAGCGPQCCTSTVLLSDINQTQWMTNFDYGRQLKPGGRVTVRNPLGGPSIALGKIDDIVISNTNDCIAIPREGESPMDCSGAFPINVEIMIDSGPRGCPTINTHIYSELYIQQPQDSAQYIHIIDDIIVVRVPGTGRVGAPYRAPIAGWRKSLKCCSANKNCVGNCYLKFGLTKFLPPGTPRVGDHVYYKTQYIGEVASVDLFVPSTANYTAYIYISPIFDPKNNMDCHSGKSPFVNNTEATLTDVVHQVYQKVIFLGYDTTLCVNKSTPLNDVYKDPSVKSCGKDNRACYNGRIRSGMQPKQQFCVNYTKVSDNSYKKHKKLLCPTDIGWQKPYSYSYSQYNKNRALNTYKRGLERNIRISNISQSACPTQSTCTSLNVYNNVKSCCQKSLYRKSGGNSCLGCVATTPCDIQWLVLFFTKDQLARSKIAPGLVVSDNGVAIGTVASATYADVGQQYYIQIQLYNCNNAGNKTDDLSIGSVWKSADRPEDVQALVQSVTNANKLPNHAITIWKTNNNKFKVQGAVTSGGRLERLKLDTIRAANSKCKKGERCDKNGNGKGPYFAGKPRFDKWMFNGRHREIVCGNKYRQQPLGIPQLTRNRRSTRSNKAPSHWKNESVRAYGNWQRLLSNHRAPGCACPSERCENELCPGEGEMVFASDSDKYQPSKCRNSSDVYLTTDFVTNTPDSPPDYIIAGKIPVTIPGFPGVIISWSGYNKFDFSFINPNFGGAQYGQTNLGALGPTQPFNNPPTYNGYEIIFFLPSFGGPAGGAGGAMIVEGTLPPPLSPPTSISFTKSSGEICTWSTSGLLCAGGPPGGAWNIYNATILNIATGAPVAVTVFTNGGNVPQGAPNPCILCNGLQTLYPLSLGDLFTLNVN